ncbi:transposase, partial [Bradyrhizobium sp. CCBAU 45394]|uniref:transposase n=1 Tax=Bradyrhizobium sp. CCBAU 45394 TaxID=1325087 RepID=UPI003FA44141
KEVEADIAREAMSDPIIRRLMTLPGVDMTVASGVAAAVGDIRRFADPTRLVSYLGLNPSVRQSGEGSAYHGRITKQGAAKLAECSSKPVRRDRCVHSSSAWLHDAASTSRQSRRRGSWR